MKTKRSVFPLGATYENDGTCTFAVWAPCCDSIAVRIYDPLSNNLLQELELEKDDAGYFFVDEVVLSPGSWYSYFLDKVKERPDPISRFLPRGVHKQSAVIDPGQYVWQDKDWQGVLFEQYILYEIHVGTFTKSGSFAGVISKLDYLVDLGITCIELMPVSQFPGERNWGYDGVSLFAVQNSYGGPEGLKRLVDACHQRGIAVCLDVVYNHLGPEGNYLHDFGPYFTDRYHTPWGDAFNYDGPDSDPVREYVIQNALYWFSEFHIDALRLDAVHAIFDFSAVHILAEIKQRVALYAEEIGRDLYVIAESDLNDVRLVEQCRRGGYGLDAQWSDDFHHAIHAFLTGEQQGYYADFTSFDELALSIEQAFVYDGCYSGYRRRRHGNSPLMRLPAQFIIAMQNHDQVGNRVWGERLDMLVPFSSMKAAAFLLLLLPYTPLLFMGQEFATDTPFLYFVDHQDVDLLEAVREGRKKEFLAFGWEEVPLPDEEGTFLDSILNWEQQGDGQHQLMLHLYKELIAIRKSMPELSRLAFSDIALQYDTDQKWLVVQLQLSTTKLLLLAINLSEQQVGISLAQETLQDLECLLTSNEEQFGGGPELKVDASQAKLYLPPKSAGLFRRSL